MSYEVVVLADSIARGKRLTTMLIDMPRFILAEFNTHRMMAIEVSGAVREESEQVEKKELAPANATVIIGTQKARQRTWIPGWIDEFMQTYRQQSERSTA